MSIGPIVITGAVKFAGYYMFCFFFLRRLCRPADSPPGLDSEGRISDDRYCRGCEYNLRGLEIGRMCPECGLTIPAVPRTYKGKQPVAAPVGTMFLALTRTVIGLIFGSLYWMTIAGKTRSGMPIDWAFLAPIRAVEWILIVLLFRKLLALDTGNAVKLVLLGTVWSYVLDIPAIFGFCLFYGPPC